jgi:predicted nuclease of predicted toxin-antitoxin system
MPEEALHLLLDQNIPEEVTVWLRPRQPNWRISHVKEVQLAGHSDPDIFRWAQSNRAIVVSFDEDFGDTRTFPLGSHHGIVRLRIWPTTVEMTKTALDRLLAQVPPGDLPGSLAIIDNQKIRLRRKP